MPAGLSPFSVATFTGSSNDARISVAIPSGVSGVAEIGIVIARKQARRKRVTARQ